MAKNFNWGDIAREILEYAGGKENIKEIFHCATRLRFVVNDDEKVDQEKLKTIGVVKGVNRDGAQWQLIIGAGTVNKVMSAIEINNGGAQGNNSGDKTVEPLWDRRLNWKANVFGITRRGVRGFAAIFIPLIALFIAGGLALALNNFIKSIEDVNTNEVADGFSKFFDHIGFAIFGSLPALVGYTAAKRWGASPLLGLAVGLAISWGGLTSSWAFYYATPPADWNVGEFSIQAIGYQAQVVPALLSILLMVVIEKFMRKVTHESVAIILVPFVTVTLTVFCALWFIGPFGRLVGEGIADLFKIINENVNFTGFGLGGMLFGFAYPFIVITGLHQSFVPIELALTSQFGYTFITPFASISNVAQGVAAIMAALMIRNKTLRSTGISGGVSCQFGITEPALFGVNIPLKYPVIAAAIGSSVGGYWAGISRLQSNSFGSASWVGLVQFDFTADNMQEYFKDNPLANLDPVAPDLAPVGHAAIAMTLACVVTAVTMFFLGRTKWAKNQIKEYLIDIHKLSFKELPKLLKEKAEKLKKNFSMEVISSRSKNYFLETAKTTKTYFINEKETQVKEVDLSKITDLEGRNVYAPFDGKVVYLEDVPDATFAQKIMGSGVAVEPTNGKVNSPVAGEVTVAFPTKHAYSFKTVSGHGILLHIGLETVALNGQGFDSEIEVGQKLTNKEEICKLDLKIKSKVKSLISPIVLLNDPDLKEGKVELVVKNNQTVKKGDLLFKIVD